MSVFRLAWQSTFFSSAIVGLVVFANTAVAGHIVSKPVFLDPGLADPRSRGENQKDFRTETPRFFTINAVLSTRGGAGDALSSSGDSSPAAENRATVFPYAKTSREPFGLHLFSAPEGSLSVKWKKIEAEIREDFRTVDTCRADAESCSREAASIVNLSDSARLKRDSALIELINVTINRSIKYRSDLDQHGEADRWTSILNTLRAGVGDCEDYAIAKYVALIQAGLENADVKILLARDSISGQDHSVVAVRQNDQWLILDNRWSAILADKDSTNLSPMFALGSNGVELFAAPYAALPSR